MSWQACTVAALVVCAATYQVYQITDQAPAPIGPVTLSDQPRPQQPRAHKPADQPRAQQQTHQLAQKPAEQPSAPNEIEQPRAAKPQPLLAGKAAAPADVQVKAVESAPAVSQPAPLPAAPTKAQRDDDAAAAPVVPIAPAAPPQRIVTKEDLTYLSYYAYAEVLPRTKPADTVLAYLKDTPPGTPIEDIRQVSDALGLDFRFMKAVAKIESGFDPKQRTGSYIGLFQLSRSEFARYGSGDILDARDNAVAAALKFMTETALFELFTHKKPTLSDVYLIHQQGVDGAAEHVSHPHRLAWRSMCATDEGREKGEKWCKRAIWGNTLPAVKRIWKSVNKLTSGAFVAMWQQRVSQFYAQYSEAAAN